MHVTRPIRTPHAFSILDLAKNSVLEKRRCEGVLDAFGETAGRIHHADRGLLGLSVRRLRLNKHRLVLALRIQTTRLHQSQASRLKDPLCIGANVPYPESHVPIHQGSIPLGMFEQRLSGYANKFIDSKQA